MQNTFEMRCVSAELTFISIHLIIFIIMLEKILSFCFDDENHHKNRVCENSLIDRNSKKISYYVSTNIHCDYEKFSQYENHQKNEIANDYQSD